jgi:glycosyltransferase involved in cell wall biosynthesis
VLHVTQPTSAGVARLVAAMAGDQVARGWRVAVARPDDGHLAGDLDPEVEQLTWAAGRSPGPAVAAEAARLRSLVSSVRPDVVHLHSSKAGLVGRLVLRASLPTVFQPNAWSWHAAGRLSTPIRRWETAAAHRWTDRIICVSHREATEGADAGIDPERMVIVPNGVELSRFAAYRSPAARAAARDRLGLPHDQRVVVCVGRICEQKGQERLLAAWGAASGVGRPVLVLVGGGDPAPLREVAMGHDVRFVGEVNRVDDYLAAADLTVMPSRWEGMSVAMLECLAAGVPTVTTAVAGSEVVASGGGQILSADPLDDRAVVAELTTALPAWLSDTDRLLTASREAAACADRHHDRETSHTAIAAVLDEVVARRSGGPVLSRSRSPRTLATGGRQ